MDYGSVTFILIFLPLLLIIYLVIPSGKKMGRNLVLLLFSVLFYAWGNVAYTLLLLFSMVCNYLIGLDLDKRIAGGKRRSAGNVFGFGILLNILLLVFFGYFTFFIDSINTIFKGDIQVKIIAVPIGILIYTMSAISYLIDIKRGITSGERNFINFGLYLAFFPRILMGPVVRYTSLENQFANRTENLETLGEGLGRFVIGLAKYTILAAVMGETWIKISQGDGLTVLTAWLGIMSCGFALYFTFSGFSDMAIGLGKAFGFHIRENFNYPYTALTQRDFWKRWNVSVVGWFREYVFLPMGGAKGSVSGYIVNTLITWILVGLWHSSVLGYIPGGVWKGPTLSSILGGAAIAILLILEDVIFGKLLVKLPGILRILYMVLTLGVIWTFFGNAEVPDTFAYIASMFGGGVKFLDASTWYYFKSNLLFYIICILALLPMGRTWKYKLLTGKTGSGLMTILYILLFLSCIVCIIQ